MHSGVFAFAILLCAALPVRAADRTAAERPVARIDTLLATLSHRQVLIQAKGAVPSGGWKGGRLRVVKSPIDPHTIVVDFVALPPTPTAAVIPGLVPIAAQAKIRMRRGVVSVRAVASSNEITTQILK